jgi:hypothetical protein
MASFEVVQRYLGGTGWWKYHQWLSQRLIVNYQIAGSLGFDEAHNDSMGCL